MVELVLNDIDFVGSGNGDMTAQDVTYAVLQTLSTSQKSKLMKLKMSNINLHDHNLRLVESLCNAIATSKNMIFLDLSWSNLAPRDLAEIASCLSDNAFAIRNRNLSYNKLNFDEANERDLGHSEVFLDSIE